MSEFFKLGVSLNIRRVYRIWAFFRIVIVAEYRVTQLALSGPSFSCCPLRQAYIYPDYYSILAPHFCQT